MECVELAPAVGCVARFESGSKLHALHTLRAVWFRLCRPGDSRALPSQPRLRIDQPDAGDLCEVAPVVWQKRLALIKCNRPVSGGTKEDYFLTMEDVQTGRQLA